MADSEAVPDIDERVRRLEARAAITDLIHRYALHIRRGEPEHCAALFTQDAGFAVRDADGPDAGDVTERAHPRGREAVMAYVTASSSHGFRVVPMIRNILVTVDGRTATATSLMSSRTWPAGAEVFGEYRDSFREEDGRWLFAGRIFTLYRRRERAPS
ncbi:MAG: nuclear transport factor 2 family protein [Sphingobium sp.]